MLTNIIPGVARKIADKMFIPVNVTLKHTILREYHPTEKGRIYISSNDDLINYPERINESRYYEGIFEPSSLKHIIQCYEEMIMDKIVLAKLADAELGTSVAYRDVYNFIRYAESNWKPGKQLSTLLFLSPIFEFTKKRLLVKPSLDFFSMELITTTINPLHSLATEIAISEGDEKDKLYTSYNELRLKFMKSPEIIDSDISVVPSSAVDALDLDLHEEVAAEVVAEGQAKLDSLHEEMNIDDEMTAEDNEGEVNDTIVETDELEENNDTTDETTTSDSGTDSDSE